MTSPPILITQATLYTESLPVTEGYLKVVDGKIAEIGPMDQLDQTAGFQEISLPKGFCVIPGMIDLHIHGVGGVDIMDATVGVLETMAMMLPREGTTSFLATTLTQSQTSIEAALMYVSDFLRHRSVQGRAECLGIHLEGPFISLKKRGAQPAAYVIPPDVELCQRWQELAQHQIKLVTLAPEVAGGLELIHHLRQTGVIASIGHSDASYAQCLAAIAAGASHITHLYNGMRGFHHRDPGVVGAAFLREELYVEVIADGVHSTAASLQLAWQQITSNRMLLVTDSIGAKGVRQGSYEWGGQTVYVTGLEARLADGTLAGSVLKMNDAGKNMRKFTGCDIRQWIEMSAVNPAKELGIFDRKGSIAVGKEADLVVIDESGDVWLTLCRGEIAFRSEE
jgi:N-acetylglucosamine-6-phosphate deacetylase